MLQIDPKWKDNLGKGGIQKQVKEATEKTATTGRYHNFRLLKNMGALPCTQRIRNQTLHFTNKTVGGPHFPFP